MEKENENKNWFEEYDEVLDSKAIEALPPIFELKLADGELARIEQIEFINDGKEKTTKFGETIMFSIKNKGIERTWFIKRNQYTLLNAIARERKAGSLVGRTATVTRTGKGQKETRLAIKFEK